jgi:uncharacterized protein
VTGIVIADTGPLIALARAGHLQLLQALYREISIPPAVQRELCLESGHPGAKRLAEAVAQGWLVTRHLSNRAAAQVSELAMILDSGEAEAIVLAEAVNCRFLLIDEWKGRLVAKQRGLPVAGLAGVLLAAKKGGLVDQVMPLIKNLAKAGYRISEPQVKEIVRLTGT